MRALGAWFKRRWTDLVVPVAFGVAIVILLFSVNLAADHAVTGWTIFTIFAVPVMWAYAIYSYGTTRERKGETKAWAQMHTLVQRVFTEVNRDEH